MSDNKRVVLCGDDLLTCNPKDYVNIPLAMYQGSDTIGIATDDNGAYYVYQKGERNTVDWKKPFDSFDSALEYAKSTYSDFVAYLDYLYGKDSTAFQSIKKTKRVTKYLDAKIEYCQTILQQVQVLETKVDSLQKTKQSLLALKEQLSHRVKALERMYQCAVPQGETNSHVLTDHELFLMERDVFPLKNKMRELDVQICKTDLDIQRLYEEERLLIKEMLETDFNSNIWIARNIVYQTKKLLSETSHKGSDKQLKQSKGYVRHSES